MLHSNLPTGNKQRTMKKILTLSIVAVTALTFSACSNQENGSQENGVAQEAEVKTPIAKEISIDELESLVAEKSPIILDVRTKEECAEGMIPGAINEDVTMEGFKKRVSSIDLDQPIVLYCKSGRRSTNAMAIMERMGYTELYNMKGGYEMYDAKKKAAEEPSAEGTEEEVEVDQD